MFATFINTSVLSLAVLLALASLGAAYRLYLVRQTDQTSLRHLSERIRRLEKDMAALCRASAGEGRRVIGIQQQVEGLAKRQDILELSANSERPYSRASRLAQEGASIDDLIEFCGVTRAEAELLVMLHGACGRG